MSAELSGDTQRREQAVYPATRDRLHGACQTVGSTRDHGVVALTLVTGPANAEKAGAVLDGYRKALARGEEPILVVPTLADVERYRTELAAGGVVFGAQVSRFAWLIDEIARRTGVRGRGLSRLARDRVTAAAIAATTLTELAGAAATAGFARALLRLVDELEAARVTPQRLTQALRAWSGEDAGRRAYGDEVAALYSSYRRLLERLDRRDTPLRTAAALDALAEQPAAWGATPVYFYGFDDLTALQLDAVRTLSAAGARVMLSLAFEPGRMAFSGRATTFAELSGPDVKHVALPAKAEHYAPASRAALHHLERELFEPGEDRLFDPAPIDPGVAIELLSGGGERAELELVAAEAARLIAAEGMAPEEIAVVLRAPAAAAPLVEEVFGAFGVPVSLERTVAFGHTPLGRGLVALLRCALVDGCADDLLTWLRTPGLLTRPQLADALEASVRRAGARSAEQARALWEAEHWPLDAIDRVRAAHERGPADLLARLSGELATLFAAPRKRSAPVLTGAQAREGRVLAAGRRALDELATLARLDRALAPAPAQLAALLAELEVQVGELPGRGRVTVTDPPSLRARRVRALFACALQEGVFPRAPRPEPFFGDVERAEIAAASGLRLRGRGDELGAERYLFYATVTRPEERLYLSWHEAGDDGDPAVRSFFVADVCDLFDQALVARTRLRTLGQVAWPDDGAPTLRERARSDAAAGPRRREAQIGPLRADELVAELRERAAWSASDIELWAGCPTKWFVERRLRPEGLQPDPELRVRGALAHCVLEATLRGLRERTGSARLAPATLALTRELALAALRRCSARAEFEMSPDPSRQRTLMRRLRADLLRYLGHAANAGSELVPEALEVSFGGPSDEHGALTLADGVRVRGRIDRIDTGPGGEAIVYDYKGRNAVASARWREERKFQVALYLIAAREVLGLDPVGGLYQPLGAEDQRARGLVLKDSDPGLDAVNTDRRERDAFEAIVDGVVDDVLTAVGELRAGALASRPDSCAYAGGCEYPTICRCDAA